MRAGSAPPAWAEDFRHAQNSSSLGAPPLHAQHHGVQLNPQEFASMHAGPQAPISAPSRSAAVSPVHATNYALGGMSGMGMHYGMMHQPMMGLPTFASHQQPPAMAQDRKGKGKLVELDDQRWEEQFAEMELQDTQAAEGALDEDEIARRKIDEALDEVDRQFAQESETGEGDFEAVWRGIQAERAAMQDDDQTWGTDHMLNTDENAWDSLGRWDQEPADMDEYLFETDNPYAQNKSAFDEGVAIMNEGGNLSLAALAFEAAVSQNPGHVEAWVMLGSAQAQNEKETAAIRANQRALRLDPNNLAALMGLAVSFTNEGYDASAYRTLERWLSVKYPSVVDPASLPARGNDSYSLGFTDRMELHQRVTDHFVQAAALSPGGEQMDPDVQVGLGVLFYGHEEYDKAVDCFEAALASSEQGVSNRGPQLHLLWNRLGATLANSQRSEEAIAAYHKALSLRPNFVRARYNLGVSCINIGCHREAAEHFLAALAMQRSVERQCRDRAREILSASGQGDGGARGEEVSDRMLDGIATHNVSTSLYDTLRRVFTQMGRRDLAEMTVVGVDPEVFRKEFDF